MAAQPDWPRQVVAGLRAALEFFAAEPDLARLCLVESVSATPTIAIRFREAVLLGVPALERGRDEVEGGQALPPNTEDSVLGGIVSLATRTTLTGDPAQLPRLLPDLVEFSLAPYLGSTAAAERGIEARISGA